MTAYHFTGDTLRNGQPIPPIGEWLEHNGPVVPCESGLHASEHPFDALTFAPGILLHLVELGGVIVPHGDPVDKLCASRRRIIKTINAELLLRAFARQQALTVIHMWDAPAVVIKYLETGDESLRAAAWAAARDAADAAWAARFARAAARDAADAAWDAAWSAAWAARFARAAARDAAAAARDAARDGDAAWDAAWDAARSEFKRLVDAAFGGAL